MMADTQSRRRDSAKTKARILLAANDTFAEYGYAQAGVREIARRADVATSLLARYFGTKASLFEQALIQTVRENSVFSFDKAGFGETMARLIQDRSNLTITTMLVLALADPEAREIAMRVSHDHMIAPLARWLGPPHAQERAMNLFSLMTGFVIQVQAMSEGIIPGHSVRWLAKTLQGIVDER